MSRLQRQQLDAAIRQRRNRIRRAWNKRPTLMRFLEDHYPIEWEKIRTCRTGTWAVDEDRMEPGEYRAYSKRSCHQLPWCIACVGYEASRRVKALWDQVSQCTPYGEEPRLAHIVIPAMVRQDRTGWGMDASRDLDGFFAGAHEALTWAYGDGIGWKGSYQDFGERPFHKRNPHLDLTLNGWAVRDGKPAKVDEYDLRGHGHDRLCAKLSSAFAKRFPGAVTTTFDLQRFKVGFANYQKAANYQLREMVDVRKITYDQKRQMVYWRDYKSPRREPYDVIDFMAGVAEYQARLGQWGYEPGKELHRAMGHMAKGNAIKRTRLAMGGIERPHPQDCACSDCGDWVRVFLEDVEQSDEDKAPLDPN